MGSQQHVCYPPQWFRFLNKRHTLSLYILICLNQKLGDCLTSMRLILSSYLLILCSILAALGPAGQLSGLRSLSSFTRSLYLPVLLSSQACLLHIKMHQHVFPAYTSHSLPWRPGPAMHWRAVAGLFYLMETLWPGASKMSLPSSLGSCWQFTTTPTPCFKSSMAFVVHLRQTQALPQYLSLLNHPVKENTTQT